MTEVTFSMSAVGERILLSAATHVADAAATLPSMGTLVVAIYGAAVATGSMVVAILAYRAGGPRLSIGGEAGLYFYEFGPLVYGALRLDNRGRGDITVTSAFVELPLPVMRLHISDLPAVEPYPSPPRPKELPAWVFRNITGVDEEFPFRLVGKSSMEISFTARLAELEPRSYDTKDLDSKYVRRLRRTKHVKVRLSAGGRRYKAAIRFEKFLWTRDEIREALNAAQDETEGTSPGGA